jgi:hypothetical protein
MGILSRFAVAAVAAGLVSGAAHALESDGFWAWGKPLGDSSEAINAKVNAELRAVVAEANEAKPGELDCTTLERRFMRRMRFPSFQTVEVWAMGSPLVDRTPRTIEEEEHYRKEWLFAATIPGDVVRWMPPSPIISIGGVRLGTDKLGHFFSEGILLHSRFEARREKGDTVAQAEADALKWSVLTERTFLGLSTSGVFSRGDLEANHEGMRFYNQLCDVDEPMLRRVDGAWTLTRPFDIRDYVTPEWDETWQSPIFGAMRWPRIRRRLETYCPLLADPAVRAERERYAARDTETETERLVAEIVASGKLADPEQFSLEHVCAEPKP